MKINDIHIVYIINLIHLLPIYLGYIFNFQMFQGQNQPFYDKGLLIEDFM